MEESGLSVYVCLLVLGPHLMLGAHLWLCTQGSLGGGGRENHAGYAASTRLLDCPSSPELGQGRRSKPAAFGPCVQGLSL